jgi:H+/Cl- antiporter ClcA
MKRLLDLSSHLRALAQIFQWTLLVAPVAVLAGSASALLLWALHTVTQWRFDRPWLLYLLPLGGLLIALIYQRFGRTSEAGNNLILEEIHAPGGGVPTRMAPLILVSTVITHLFGGSAGREGTAVQMGGSLAATWGRWFNFSDKNRRVLLLAGVAAGFGSVFGTPLAGAIFAMEVLVIGRMQYDALIPVLVASVIGDMACSAWGTHHLAYHIAIIGTGHGLHLEPGLLAKVAVAGATFGLASTMFVEVEHALKSGFKKFVRWPWLRPVIGGTLIIGLVGLLGTRDYLGLGVDPCRPGGITILSAFDPGGAQPFSWWWKLLFTALTLACGFKGGEVTPLFFIGAALGHTLAGPLGAPVDLFAGLGFIAVFGAAANTPMACTIMGAELFGTPYLVYFAVGCFVAYYFSGHAGIYLSQRLGVAKKAGGVHLPDDVSLRQAREIDATFAGMSPPGWRPGDDHAKDGGGKTAEEILIMKEKAESSPSKQGKSAST